MSGPNDLAIKTARLDEKLGHIDDTMKQVLAELRSLRDAMTGEGGHAERLTRIEGRLDRVEKDVSAFRLDEGKRAEAASALRGKIIASVVSGLALSAVAGWFAGHS